MTKQECIDFCFSFGFHKVIEDSIDDENVKEYNQKLVFRSNFAYDNTELDLEVTKNMYESKTLQPFYNGIWQRIYDIGHYHAINQSMAAILQISDSRDDVIDLRDKFKRFIKH